MTLMQTVGSLKYQTYKLWLNCLKTVLLSEITSA